VKPYDTSRDDPATMPDAATMRNANYGEREAKWERHHRHPGHQKAND